MTDLILRPHQEKCLEATADAFASGHQSVLNVLTTGAGKTHIGLYWLYQQYVEALKNGIKNPRIVWFAHRRELIHQPRDRVAEFFQGLLPTPGIVMAESNHVSAPFIIASMRTLDNRYQKILDSGGQFVGGVYDEAHHSVAEENKKILEAFTATGMKLMGVTATPKRADNAGLKEVYETVAYRLSLVNAINLGILCPIVPYAASLDVSFNDVKKYKGDYQQKDADRIINSGNWLQIIYDKWCEVASERPTIAFCMSVASADVLAQHFKTQGVAAATINAMTPKKERDEILRDYASGKLQFISNCMVLTEGFDAPQTSCILNARPTKNDSLYLQMIGRGLRLHPGKENCVVVDFAPQDARDIELAGNLLGKTKELKILTEQADREGVSQGTLFIPARPHIDPEQVKLVILDYMMHVSKLAWTTTGKLSVASIGDKMSLAIVAPQPELLGIMQKELAEKNIDWQPHWNRYGNDFILYYVTGQQFRLIAHAPSFEELTEIAEQKAREYGDTRLASRAKKWRNEQPSESQLKHFKHLYTPGMSKGQLSKAISYKMVEKTLKKKRRLL